MSEKLKTTDAVLWISLLFLMKTVKERGFNEFSEGIGNLISKLKDLLQPILQNPDIVPMAGLAYIGYKSYLQKLMGTPIALMWGPIGYKLATTPTYGGTVGASVGWGAFKVDMPVNSQVAGLSMLTTLGFACLPWEDIAKNAQNDIVSTRESLNGAEDFKKKWENFLTPEERDRIFALEVAVGSATLGTRADLAEAQKNLSDYLESLEAQLKVRGMGRVG